ncbi:MAG: 3-isopropylmalate dehydratase small subunit [Clostridiales Family XIII bacterium]|jgi:3-isopropylmalate/(R)-2-methylmalate dehydratase small subunit|nr:3-isopropylmalate dehydratase small subunit [Clostridiales Family XIII bacterium]
MIIKGKVWKFGDDINTDLIFPHTAFRVSPEEQPRYVFSDNRPGWSASVGRGDIIVAGRNFGTGSSRPGAVLLKRLGLGGMLSDSMNGLFFRNCIGYGFPAMQCAGVSALFDEGDVAEFDLTSGEIRNLTSGATALGNPISRSMAETLEAGGIFELLTQKGYIEA